ncbi:MAG: hypothetical protein ACOX6T_16530 [Myxococcales bacterium]
MKNRNWLRLPTLGLCCLALGLAYCGGEEGDPDKEPTKDGGIYLPDAGTKTDAGTQEETDAGSETDAGEEPGTDGGTKPELQELQNVTLHDIRTNTGTYVNLETRKSLAIVNVKGVKVVSDYAHSDGNHSVYIEQGSGAERAGILFYISPGSGVTIPEVGSTMDVRGCVNTYWSVLQIQYCNDSEHTQATFSNVQPGTLPDLAESDKFPAAELAGDSAAHEDRIGLRVQATGTLTVLSEQPAFCRGSNNNDVYCIALSDGVYIKTRFTYSCEGRLDGPFTNLVGVWDWYQSGSTTIRTIVPLSCDALAAAEGN